jgi:hypothetical protein
MYTRSGNVTGQRFSAHRFNFFTKQRRQSLGIGEPHNQQPRLVVSFVQDDWALASGIADGLFHPDVGVATLAVLHLQMNVRE